MIAGVFAEDRAVHEGGANGSIIGRNTFRRPKVRAILAKRRGRGEDQGTAARRPVDAAV